MCLENHPPTRWLAPLLLLLTMCGAISDSVPQVANVQELGEKFSCEGRSAGFYADVSSGCQMYHMCDEAGRVFTHTCPERTLFQQRTMVCDHWYMVECSATRAALRAPARAARPLQGAPPPASPGRKRHSQRVIATFPYQQGNDTSIGSTTTTRPLEKLESFKISSISSNTPRTPFSSTAIIERVTRPSFVTGPLVQHSDSNRQQTISILPRPSPTLIGRATIERVFKDPFPVSHNDDVSQAQYLSSFREGKSGPSVISTISRTSTEITPSLVENKYKQNPFFESYFKTSFTLSSPVPPQTFTTTTQRTARREEEESVENRLEIVIADPRKMFYIPDSNYDPGDASKNEGTVLVIDLPVRNTMKFQRVEVEVKEARNKDCPQCHPSFLLPGLCRPCVLIRR